MSLTKVFSFSMCFGLSVGAATAQDRAARFVERDGNGDGVLSPHEYQTTGGHPGNFRALDSNGDGVLTRAEFLGREGGGQDELRPTTSDETDRDPAVLTKRDPDVLTKDVLTKAEFGRIDANRDNLITRREWTGDASTFRRLDINNDGYVSSAEYVAAAPLVSAVGSVAARSGFEVKDRNRDGMLTRSEYGEDRTFDRVDRNHDDRISYDEFLNPPSDQSGGFSGSTQNTFMDKDRNRDGLLTRSEYGEDRTFDRVDRNDDGRISYDEFLNPPPVYDRDERFDDLDRNGDGVLSRREWDGSASSFRALDRNRDGRVTFDEFDS